MTHRFADIAFTPAVQALQQRHGSRAQYARMQARGRTSDDVLGPREAQFIADADSFYLATVSETGWPYVQHRGGPRGFVKLLSPTSIGYADFRGNLQYVSAGNVLTNDRASLIFMDYVNRRRLKLLGHLRFVDVAEADRQLVRQMNLPGYQAHVERIALIDVVAFDWNCPQHITQRYALEQVTAATEPLRARIKELEAKPSAMQS